MAFLVSTWGLLMVDQCCRVLDRDSVPCTRTVAFFLEQMLEYCVGKSNSWHIRSGTVCLIALVVL